ncbi:MAG: hypothetical protein IJ764_08045 [Bacteroidales bacterium]|nr:hypothetical protein [Bacteroidales bacterium]
MNKVIHRIYNKPIDQRWEIGFLDVCIDDLLKGKPYRINIIKHHYTQGWFADPFVLDVTDDEIFLLVEEWHYANRRGRISRLAIDRKTLELLEVTPVLQLNSHLSFPAIRRVDDEVFVYPENAKGKGLAMYHYNKLGRVFEACEVLTSMPLLDAVITNGFGPEYIFATTLDNPSRQLRWFEVVEGRAVERGIISFADDTARNAGDWFVCDGKMYRPAQDCNQRYGGSVILQEVHFEGGAFTFTDTVRITTTSKRYNTGCHTLNQFKDVCVVDVHGYKYPKLAKMYNSLFCRKQ